MSGTPPRPEAALQQERIARNTVKPTPKLRVTGWQPVEHRAGRRPHPLQTNPNTCRSSSATNMRARPWPSSLEDTSTELRILTCGINQNMTQLVASPIGRRKGRYSKLGRRFTGIWKFICFPSPLFIIKCHQVFS